MGKSIPEDAVLTVAQEHAPRSEFRNLLHDVKVMLSLIIVQTEFSEQKVAFKLDEAWNLIEDARGLLKNA